MVREKFGLAFDCFRKIRRQTFRYPRMNPLAKLLHHFAPHADLLRRSRGGSRYKTGTFSGVRTLAGYANTSNHGQVRFVAN